MATAGKLFVVECSVDELAWSRVAEINDASMSVEGSNVEITAFGDAFVRRMQGIKDAGYSMSGFATETDLNGQRRMKMALIEDTPLFIRMLYDGTNGMSQEVKVASFEVSASVDGVAEVSFDLEGTGAVTLVP